MRHLALLALAPLLSGIARHSPPVAYTLSPEMKDSTLEALDVEVRYAVGAKGVSEFAWAQQWESEKALWRWARDFHVEGAASVDEPSGGVWRIRAQPGTVVTVRYRVVSAYDHDPTGDDSAQPKPIIRPTWFYTTGHSVFGAPRDALDDPATFRWLGDGSGLRFASDLEHLSVAHGTVGDVRSSILVGDRDLKLSGDLGSADKVRIAEVSGAYPFDFAVFDRLARRIVHKERAFFGEDDSAPFLVAASPIRTGRGVQGFSGTGLGDAFALWLDQNASLDEMRWLLAHEYFHTWNPRRLGGSGNHTTAGPIAWFSEGFTDYYARALMVRAEVITPQEFARLWNRTLRDYAASPVRTAPNSRIAADFHNDEPVQMLAYQRGAMLAALWNARLRKESHGRYGLDDVIRAQHAWMKQRPDEPRAAPDLFEQIAGSRFGLDLRADVARYVVEGQPIALPPRVFGPCARLADVRRPEFDRGFDGRATAQADNVVQGTRPGSKAYAAGLRDGMKLISRESGEPGEPEIPYVLNVDDHGAARVIRYLPKSRGTTSVTRLVIQPGASRKFCARSLSGL